MVLFTNKDYYGSSVVPLNCLPVTSLYSVDKIFQCNRSIEVQNQQVVFNLIVLEF